MSCGGGTRRTRSASEVPVFMDKEFDGKGGWVALAQFAALVAALVHALCIRGWTPVT